MSRGNRWYVLARETALATTDIVPVPRGTVYVFEGWSRTKEAANERIDALDKLGRQGVKVFSRDREQAARDLWEIYGIKVKGYPSGTDRQYGRAIVKSAVMREIFCPYTGAVLDMRRAVVVEGVSLSVMAATHWDKVLASYEGGLAALRAENERRTGKTITVYDGRELFKR